MGTRRIWTRGLVVAGLLAMLVGAIDPLEGAFVILPGSGLVTMGAYVAASRYRRLLGGTLGLIAFGVGAMIVLSLWGGIGGSSGHSIWWGLFVLPYPIGWLLGLGTGVVTLIELFKRKAGAINVGILLAFTILFAGAF